MHPKFTAALFTTAETWKQPKCPSTEEWIKKMWYRYTMEYYSAIKKNEIMSFVATWIDLEIVILSEVSQRRRNIVWHPLYVESSVIHRNLFTKETHREQIYGCQEEGSGEGIVREFEIDMYTLLYLKWKANKVLLYSMRNSAQCNVAASWEGSLGKNGYMYIYGWVPLLSTWNYHNIVFFLKVNDWEMWKCRIKE